MRFSRNQAPALVVLCTMTAVFGAALLPSLSPWTGQAGGGYNAEIQYRYVNRNINAWEYTNHLFMRAASNGPMEVGVKNTGTQPLTAAQNVLVRFTGKGVTMTDAVLGQGTYAREPWMHDVSSIAPGETVAFPLTISASMRPMAEGCVAQPTRPVPGPRSIGPNEHWSVHMYRCDVTAQVMMNGQPLGEAVPFFVYVSPPDYFGTWPAENVVVTQTRSANDRMMGAVRERDLSIAVRNYGRETVENLRIRVPGAAPYISRTRAPSLCITEGDDVVCKLASLRGNGAEELFVHFSLDIGPCGEIVQVKPVLEINGQSTVSDMIIQSAKRRDGCTDPAPAPAPTPAPAPAPQPAAPALPRARAMGTVSLLSYPGETVAVELKFQNIGQTIWTPGDHVLTFVRQPEYPESQDVPLTTQVTPLGSATFRVEVRVPRNPQEIGCFPEPGRPGVPVQGFNPQETWPTPVYLCQFLYQIKRTVNGQTSAFGEQANVNVYVRMDGIELINPPELPVHPADDSSAPPPAPAAPDASPDEIDLSYPRAEQEPILPFFRGGAAPQPREFPLPLAPTPLNPCPPADEAPAPAALPVTTTVTPPPAPVCGNQICEGRESAYACTPTAGHPNSCAGHIYCPEDCGENAVDESATGTTEQTSTCGNNVCEGRESAYACTPAFGEPNTCAGHIFCPQDCGENGTQWNNEPVAPALNDETPAAAPHRPTYCNVIWFLPECRE